MPTASGRPQAAEHEHAAAINQIIGEFRGTITGVIRTVSDNVSRMEATARTLSAVARRPTSRRARLRLSSEKTSANVQTVAGAADQLGESIREINAQAAEAHSVVHRATEIARSADNWSGNCRPAPTGSATWSC